jgi:hypothetical protein
MPLVQLRTSERKDAVMTEHLRGFAGEESVLFVGKATGVDARLPTEKHQEPCRSALANVGAKAFRQSQEHLNAREIYNCLGLHHTSHKRGALAITGHYAPALI